MSWKFQFKKSASRTSFRSLQPWINPQATPTFMCEVRPGGQGLL